MRSDVNMIFAGPSHVLFLRNRTVMAQGFDPAGLKLAGDPFPVIQDVGEIPLVITSYSIHYTKLYEHNFV